ncbi:MAG: DUF2723 domain-containing protein [candidate division WOR-3 bacterium]
MNSSRLRLLLFCAVSLVVMLVYLYSVAPTAAFWDCGELIAVSYIAGVPHPPGTPLFVMLGRLFSLVPFGREIAFRVNMIPVLFGAVSCGIIYLLVVKLITLFRARGKEDESDPYLWMPHVAGVFAALMCGFAYSYWDNCVEAEVYGPCVLVALSVLYLALIWRDGVVRGTGDNRLLLAAMFLLFLAAGIHFTPMLTVFALLVFALVVDRQAVIQLRFFELWAGFLVLLTVQEMGFSGATLVAVPLMLGAMWLGIRVMENSDRTRSVLYGLGLLFLVFVIGYVATGARLMDDMVLFIASPTVALIERWTKAPWLVVVFVLAFGGYLYWLYRNRKLVPKYVGMMLALVFLAGSVQFIMFIRAKHRPAINEVEPSNWRDFVSVLKREQYDPMRLLPRKTQFLTEEDWRRNQNPVHGVFRAYVEQIAFYTRYFFWQWGNERFFDMLFTSFPKVFMRLSWQGLLGLIPALLGLWGMVRQFRRDKRAFVLIFMAFVVASLGLITYLNLKYSPSDPRPQYRFREVRERDYFYAFSFVFYTIFIGIGAYAALRWLATEVKQRRALLNVGSAVMVMFAFVPMFLNYKAVTRRGNWIPAEYGYNMLLSCSGEKAVVFTNGDNDTFPLWFMQTVPSRVADFDPNFGKNVAVANLSLLNTNWYCKQLKRWGAPISFSEEQIDKLPPGYIGRSGRQILLKDVMIRDIVATAGGVRLKFPDDYETSSEAFIAKVFGPGYVPRTPVYFATTVSPDNLVDVASHLRLEGLVKRVVAERDIVPGEGQVDVERTRHLLMNAFKLNSILDPRVERDDNTRGLLTNYAHSYLMLAGEYARRNDFTSATDVLTAAVRFDLESTQRALLFYYLSRYAALSRDYKRAQAAVDSALAYGKDDPRLRLELSLQDGAVSQVAGNYQRAEKSYLEALAIDPSRREVMQALLDMYLEDMHDTGRARTLLTDWLRRSPADSSAAVQLRGLSGQP